MRLLLTVIGIGLVFGLANYQLVPNQYMLMALGAVVLVGIGPLRLLGWIGNVARVLAIIAG